MVLPNPNIIVIIVILLSLHMKRTYSGDAKWNITAVHWLLASIETPSTIVIYDDYVDYQDWLMFRGRDEHYTTYYNYEHIGMFLEQHMRDVLENCDIMADYRIKLFFLLICRSQCIRSTIAHATELDNTVGLCSLLRHFSTWLIITPDTLPNLDTPFDHVTVVQPNSSRPEDQKAHACTARGHPHTLVENMTIYTLMWREEGRRWSQVSVDDVPPDRMYTTLFPNTLTGLNGRQLVLATLHWVGDVIRREINGTVIYTGAGIDVFDLLKSTYNFTYKIVEPEDKLWGQTLENGTVTGVMGMVARAEADTCPALYGKTYRRNRVVSFTTHVSTSEVKACYIMTRNKGRPWIFLLSCFQWSVYLLGAMTFLVFVSLFAVIVVRFSKFHPSSALSYGFDLGLRVILRQDILIHPTSTSAKVLQYSWCMFCLVMTAVFTGNLVATTAVGNTDPPFTTLEELANRKDFQIGVLEGSYPESILMTSRDPVIRALSSRMSKIGSTEKEMRLAVQKLTKGHYAFLGSNSVRRYMTAKTCDYRELPEIINPLHNAFIFPLHSPLAKLFDEKITHLRESGVFREMEKKFDPKRKICDTSKEIPRQNMDTLKTVFVTVAACVFVSCLVLIVELKVKVSAPKKYSTSTNVDSRQSDNIKS